MSHGRALVHRPRLLRLREEGNAFGVTTDGSGNVFVAGRTRGALLSDVLPPPKSEGSYDAYVRKYDSAGTELWTRQLGPPTATLL